MELYFIRHGETQANLDSKKPAILTKEGNKQVELLSNYLKDEKVDLILSSDLERAKLTAQMIKKVNKSNPQLEITSDLQEIYRLIVGDKPKGGTRPNRFEEDYQRANNFYEKLLKLNINKIFIISHGNIMKFFIAKALGIDPKFTNNIILDPSSITKIIVNESVEIKYINNTNHLEKEYSNKTIYAE